MLIMTYKLHTKGNEMKSFTKKEIGCYSDSMRGYMEQGLKVQEIAVAYGMEDKRILDMRNEFFDDAVDEAIEFLNTLTEDGLVWEFRDGDFGLYEIEESL